MPVVPLEVPLDWVWGSVYLFFCNHGCDGDPPEWAKGLIPLIHHGTVPIAPMGPLSCSAMLSLFPLPQGVMWTLWVSCPHQPTMTPFLLY